MEIRSSDAFSRDARWWLEKSKDNDWFGDVAEDLWESVFVQSLIPFIPLHKIETGKAPVIQSQNSVTLPDAQFFGRDFNAVVDFKGKSRSVLYHKFREERHGINRRVFLDYQRSGYWMNSNAGIAILELCRQEPSPHCWSGALLLGPFTRLGAPREGIGKELGDKVYWPRDSFTELATFNPSALRSIVEKRHSPPSFRQQILKAFGESGDKQGWLI